MSVRAWRLSSVLWGVLAAACAPTSQVVPQARPSSSVGAVAGVGPGLASPAAPAVNRPPFALVREERGLAWKDEWNQVIADALEDVGQPLLEDDKVPAREVEAMCPGYFAARREEKKAFWALLFASIARLESGFDPERTFMEPKPLRTLSVGLLQVSYGDEERHRGCPLDAMQANITDPGVNLRCGVAIMRNQLAARSTLFPQRYYYWSVLTRKRASIERDFAQHRAQLAFCR
ncbi:transglycosylase SLT domain-containing protein [Myxococcaceae bacterium GXIMD 01537]